MKLLLSVCLISLIRHEKEEFVYLVGVSVKIFLFGLKCLPQNYVVLL